MINAKHIRIGVNLKSTQTGDAITTTWHDIKTAEADPKLYEPIQITPDWLRGLGFELNGNQFNGPQNFIVHETSDGYICQFEHLDFIPVQYIHELQNLYLVLVGEELELNVEAVVEKMRR
jgi:hypothetical protein